MKKYNVVFVDKKQKQLQYENKQDMKQIQRYLKTEIGFGEYADQVV